MTTDTHGTPCWFELGTTDLDAAAQFYQRLFGWTVERAPMPEMDYRLASLGTGAIAGLMSNEQQPGSPPPNWAIYVAVDSCDAAVAHVAEHGGKTLVPPSDIPGTGRFAVLADPQGAVFGVLQPAPMESGRPTGGAFNQQAAGHGNWIELATSDPQAALSFYSGLFGWQQSREIDMGDGAYRLIAHNGQDIGGITGQGAAPAPLWLPYFGVDAVAPILQTINEAGGTVVHGPAEVPGPAFVAIALDPQQAVFAVVGPAA